MNDYLKVFINCIMFTSRYIQLMMEWVGLGLTKTPVLILIFLLDNIYALVVVEQHFKSNSGIADLVQMKKNDIN